VGQGLGLELQQLFDMTDNRCDRLTHMDVCFIGGVWLGRAGDTALNPAPYCYPLVALCFQVPCLQGSSRYIHPWPYLRGELPTAAMNTLYLHMSQAGWCSAGALLLPQPLMRRAACRLLLLPCQAVHLRHLCHVVPTCLQIAFYAYGSWVIDRTGWKSFRDKMVRSPAGQSSCSLGKIKDVSSRIRAWPLQQLFRSMHMIQHVNQRSCAATPTIGPQVNDFASTYAAELAIWPAFQVGELACSYPCRRLGPKLFLATSMPPPPQLSV
jgi:hypothetical protein